MEMSKKISYSTDDELVDLGDETDELCGNDTIDDAFAPNNPYDINATKETEYVYELDLLGADEFST